MIKQKKITKLVIAILLISIFCCIAFLALLFSNSSYTVKEQKVSAALVDKIREAQKQGSTVELNKEELNEIISMYFKGEKSSGNLKIKGVSGDITNGNLKLFIPVSYSGINILISSEGGLTYKDNNIEYTPLYFKAGKITLPKSFVLNKIKGHLKEGITVKSENVLIDKSMLPLKVKSIKINNDKISIGIEKAVKSLEENLKSIENKAKGTDPSSSNLKPNSEEQVAKGNSSTSNQNNSSNSSTPGAGKDTSVMNAALDRISGGLYSAMSSVSTGGQKAVISAMISAANSMKGNPNANPYAYASSARAVYKNLSPQEKAELKSAVFSNVNGADVNIVSNMLGK